MVVSGLKRKYDGKRSLGIPKCFIWRCFNPTKQRGKEETMKANALSEEEIIEHANDKCHVVTRMVNQGHY